MSKEDNSNNNGMDSDISLIRAIRMEEKARDVEKYMLIRLEEYFADYFLKNKKKLKSLCILNIATLASLVLFIIDGKEAELRFGTERKKTEPKNFPKYKNLDIDQMMEILKKLADEFLDQQFNN